MTDLRERDPKIRELVLRIIDQAPEPAPFPVGAVPPRAPRRRGRMLLAAACVAVLLVAAVVLATKSSSDKKPHISTSQTTALAAVDPLRGARLPKQGLAVITGTRMTLRTDAGAPIATVPVAKPGDDVLNDPWNLQLFVTSDGVRVVHLPLTFRTGVPSGCTVPTATASPDVAVCGARNGDQLLGDEVVADTNRWQAVITKPPVPNGVSVVDGHWEWAARSPDGKSVIAQWSGECETQTAFVISVSDGSVHAVTGEAGSAWGDAPESSALGWTSTGQILTTFGGSDAGCGSSSSLPRGVYAVSPTDLSRRLLVPLTPTATVLRWTSIDDGRGSTAPPSRAPAPTGDVVPVVVPSGCPNVQITPPETADDPLTFASDAAIGRFVDLAGWNRSDTVVDAKYRMWTTGGTSGGLTLDVSKDCGTAVADNSYAVELHDPKAKDPSVQRVVVAHFAVGWRVWGYAAAAAATPRPTVSVPASTRMRRGRHSMVVSSQTAAVS
jgi:hypothetical protein